MRFVMVVCATSKLEILDRGLAAGGEWDNIVIFEKPSLRAATVRALKGAPAAVSLPYRPFHRGAYMA
jgi:hypothetical protein